MACGEKRGTLSAKACTARRLRPIVEYTVELSTCCIVSFPTNAQMSITSAMRPIGVVALLFDHADLANRPKERQAVLNHI